MHFTNGIIDKSALRLVFFLPGVFCCASAGATSGWDRHDILVGGQYRVHGVNGSSAVHPATAKRDAAGRYTGPPFCTTRGNPSIHGPPEYLLTESYLLLKYSPVPNSHGEQSIPRHYFVIDRGDDTVHGPLELSELHRMLEISTTGLSWNAPSVPRVWPLQLKLLLAYAVRHSIAPIAMGVIVILALGCAYRRGGKLV